MGVVHPRRRVVVDTVETGAVRTREQTGPLFRTVAALGRFFREAQTCMHNLENELPGCEIWFHDNLNALQNWDVEGRDWGCAFAR